MHNIIASNALIAVGVRGKRCRSFNSDAKIRINLPGYVRFYYPVVSVVCRLNPPDDSFQDEPAVIFEVLSRRTRRIDEGEMKDAYLQIPSLEVYALIEQETPGGGGIPSRPRRHHEGSLPGARCRSAAR